MARSIYYFTDSPAFGGAEQALLTLIGALDRSVWQPTLLVSESPVASVLFDRAGQMDVPVRAVPTLPLGLSGARRVPQFAEMLAGERPDVFHASLSSPLSGKFALSAAVMARIGAVVGTVQLVPPFKISRSSHVQLQALVSRMGRILAVSRGIRRKLVEEFGWPAAKVDVIYNAVPTRPPGTPSRALRSELARGRDWPLVLVTARLDAQKGLDVLLDAATRLPGVMFVLAGDGRERARLEALSAGLGLSDRVRFLGQRDDVPALLDACDVFALPSLYEGSSLSVLEAMASARAVVTSDIPGTNELIVDGHTGLLTPPGDPAALAAALQRALGDADLRRRLGDEAREHVESEFSAPSMARSVTSVYDQLLSRRSAVERWATDANGLVRAADWRFLLRQERRPVALNLAAGRLRAAVDPVTDRPAALASSPCDLVVCGQHDGRTLHRARARLRPGGELVARWSFPRPGGPSAIRRALRRAGFEDIRIYWPGPDPSRPEFWLELDSLAARAYVLEHRPALDPSGRLLRLGWHGALRSGLLAPIYAVARVPDTAAGSESPSAPEQSGPTRADRFTGQLLLTGGRRAINKVVAVELSQTDGAPSRVVKFARVDEAEPALRHESEVLQALARTHPTVVGVPRVLAEIRRAGRLGVVESALSGTPMLRSLTEASFAQHASGVTEWLLRLATQPASVPRAEWFARLIEAPLATFAEQFGPVLEPGVAAAASARMQSLGDMPLVFEHRDCSPWNILLDHTGAPILLDWESAEPHGLPCLDLIYFLGNAAFVLDGSLETGTTRATYRALLDDRTTRGRVAAECLQRYCAALGLDRRVLPALRLLTWMVHARSDFRHLQLEAQTGRRSLLNAPFLGLILEELECSAG